MKSVGLLENEKAALAKLKKTLVEQFALVDFRVFGSKARGDAAPDSDVDVMIEVEDYTPLVESGIDDLIFSLNLEFDCFISAVIFGRKELEEGPLGESPLYRVISKEGLAV